MMADINWELRCPTCDFKCFVVFDSEETEENKEIIRACPCGHTMDIVREEKGGAE